MLQKLGAGLRRGLSRAASAASAVPLPVLLVALLVAAWLLWRRTETFDQKSLDWVQWKCGQGVSLADLVRADGNVKKAWESGDKSALKKACEKGKSEWKKSGSTTYSEEQCKGKGYGGSRCSVAVVRRKFPCAGTTKGACCDYDGNCMSAKEAAGAINQRTNAKTKPKKTKTKKCSVYMYQNTHFTGDLFHKAEDQAPDPSKKTNVDSNKASSLKLAGAGCRVTLYQKSNGGGYSLTLPAGDYPNLGAFATEGANKGQRAEDGVACLNANNDHCWNDTVNSYALHE